jgi:alkyl sulfatase BDS1-like metallo-beta-lactamase superfamily hydrolase
MKAVCTAEDATHTLHNTYSLRGAKIRYPLDWSKYLNWVLDNWSDIETIYAPHHWPVWGKGEVRHHLEIQRDMYRYINDQALNLANKGYTMIEIAEMVKLPESLDKVFSNRGYYGSMNHDVKTVYVQYLGWFDGNPATLHVLPPVESSKKYVEFMGGAQNILKMAQASFDKGEYRWVAQVVNHVVFADPKNQDAKNLQADALEQLGYQAESGPWRNFYLTGAQELRNGILPLPAPNTNSPDMMQAMTLELVFDYMGVRLNGPKAAGKDITLNFDFTDTKEKYVLFLSNGALSHSENKQSSDADASITLTRTKFNELMLGETKLEDAITSGAVKINGNQKALTNLLSLLDSFEFWFNIVTP